MDQSLFTFKPITVTHELNCAEQRKNKINLKILPRSKCLSANTREMWLELKEKIDAMERCEPYARRQNSASHCVSSIFYRSIILAL